MTDEALINRLYDIVDEITRIGGEQERTSVTPGILVADASPSDLPTGYIKIVNPRDGTYVPCLTINGLVVSDNDLVNVLFTKGTEPIALSQSSNSPSNTLKVSEVWESDFGAVALQADTDGDIGIGTALPSARLDVFGPFRQGRFIADADNTSAGIAINRRGTGDGSILFTESGVADYWSIGHDQSNGDTFVFSNSSVIGTNVRLAIETGGNVGISTSTPNTLLEVSQGSIFADGVQSNTVFDGVTAGATAPNVIGSDGFWAMRTATNNSFNIDVFNGGSELAALTILQSGNVGIGTTSPQGKLHGYDAISGFLHWEYDGLDATVRTVIPNGTGDVLYRLIVDYIIRSSAPALAAGSTQIDPGGSVGVGVGADTVTIAVAANGAVTTSRTAGANTHKVVYRMFWL